MQQFLIFSYFLLLLLFFLNTFLTKDAQQRAASLVINDAIGEVLKEAVLDVY